MILDSINADRRLYIMRAGRGYTCYGFDVLDAKARAVAAWCKAAPPDAPVGTEGHFTQCAGIMAAGEEVARRSGTVCPAELTAELIGLEGRRVEVLDAHGERRRFTVGKSTGWLPVHLELTHDWSAGGAPVTGAPFREVLVIR